MRRPPRPRSHAWPARWGAHPRGRHAKRAVGSLTTTWVLHEGPGTLRTIDPKLSKLYGASTRAPIGGSPRYMTIGPGAIWVSSFNSDTVSRVNPSTGTVSERIPVGDSP